MTMVVTASEVCDTNNVKGYYVRGAVHGRPGGGGSFSVYNVVRRHLDPICATHDVKLDRQICLIQ